VKEPVSHDTSYLAVDTRNCMSLSINTLNFFSVWKCISFNCLEVLFAFSTGNLSYLYFVIGFFSGLYAGWCRLLCLCIKTGAFNIAYCP